MNGDENMVELSSVADIQELFDRYRQRGLTIGGDFLTKLGKDIEDILKVELRRVLGPLKLGDTVELCGDKLFVGVVTAVEVRFDRDPRYCIRYREGRSIREEWMGADEIASLAQIGELER